LYYTQILDHIDKHPSLLHQRMALQLRILKQGK
jgi:hypothetical protein